MTGAPSLSFPSSRTLVAWWKLLAARRPRRLWVGHLLLHHVEALVRLSKLCPSDPFTQFVLKVLPLAGATLDQADSRLHLGRQVLRQVLRHLQGEGLVEADSAGRWRTTPLGRQALDQGTYPRTDHERRTFYFVESERRDQPPHFLNVTRPGSVPWPAPDGWDFEVRHLETCVQRPDEWKRLHGFPLEVQDVLAVETNGQPGPGQPPSWQRVVLDRPERLPAVIVLAPDAAGGDLLLGFGIQQEGWALQAGEPAFALDGGWQEAFPDLAEATPPEAWRRAWLAWCQSRNIPAADAEACVLEPVEHRLRVVAPGRLMQRLRSARSEALKHEAWILAGEGRIRAAALLDVVEAPPPGR